MRIIQHQSKSIEKLLKTPKPAQGKALRPLIYTLQTDVEDGRLLYNGLTGEMLLIAPDENADDYLYAHRFFVPDDHDDRKLCDELRTLLNIFGQTRAKGIRSYTILTTTDCNARCFYCYEQGCEKMTMTEQTAHDVAAYIAANAPKQPDAENVFSSGGQEHIETPKSRVHLSWFGGEPLFNAAAIDTICNDLTAADCEYSSSMISNGYLFDSEMIEKAVELWHLNHIQITLDGTREIYNRRKAYIYDDPDPFDRVMNNIKALAQAGVTVAVRLNADEHNHDDLSALIEQIYAFSDTEKANISVYSHLLFQREHTADDILRRSLFGAHYEMEDDLIAKGLRKHGNPPKGIRVNGCMADGINSVVILPDGRFHSCEHFVDNDIWGSIKTGETKKTPCITTEDGATVVSPLNFWSEKMPLLPECSDCFAYPQCIRLKHCPNVSSTCSAIQREHLHAVRIDQMRHKYQREKYAFTACFADVPIRIRPLFPATKTFCRNYIVDDQSEPILKIEITQKDIAFERQKSAETDELENRTPVRYSDQYLETLAVYRKIADGLVAHDIILMHGSALMFDNTSGYLFAGISGAGKSTHARIWRRVYGDRVTMINDDKPLIRFETEDIFICGTPWDGKHRLSTNTKAPLKGICFIKQGETNSIRRLDENLAFAGILQQTYRPKASKMMNRTLELLNRIKKEIPVYELTCNMEDDAAMLAMTTMCNRISRAEMDGQDKNKVFTVYSHPDRTYS